MMIFGKTSLQSLRFSRNHYNDEQRIVYVAGANGDYTVRVRAAAFIIGSVSMVEVL